MYSNEVESIINIELSTKEGEMRNSPYVTSATVTINDIILGDVNGDGDVTITDAVSIVNHRLDPTPVRFLIFTFWDLFLL